MDGENEIPADAMGGEMEMDAAMDEMDAGMGAMDDMDGAMESPEPAEGGGQPAGGDEEEGDMVEEAIDYSKDPRLEELKNYLNELYNYKEPDHWKDEFYRWMLDFLDDPQQRVLFFWNDFRDEENCPLQVSNTGPPNFYGENIKPDNYNVACFIKKLENESITIGNLREAVMFKMIFKEPLDDLLDKMNQDYVKVLLADNDWPDGVKKDFVANVHKFMAFLNEQTHMARGQTYLYIPQEDLNDPEANARDRDLLQRLESIVIGWTRQIKELVSSQDSPNAKTIETPLDEINYWSRRTNNLKILTERLDHPDLQKITQVLKIHKSSYLQSFSKLRTKISEGYEEAKDNLRFLGTLAEPCRKIAQATPKNIPSLLPDVLNSVRVIWELSTHYNTEERMKSLLVKISNQIIDRCKAKIDVQDMLYGDVEKCMQDLQESITCCEKWIDICGNQQQLIKKYSSRPNWKLDTETIFAENEAFIQRCKELMEICEGQLQFARKGKNQRMPIFGGVQGATYTNNLLELEKSFNKNLQKIAALKYDILDVKNTQWHDDYGQLFKEDCKSLEMTIHNIISLAFKNVSTVSDAVELLENFDTLAKRPLVRDFVHRKAADMVYKLFAQEIKEVEDTFESQGKKAPPMPFSHPKHAGLAIWAYSLIVRLDRARNAVRNLHFVPESNLQKEALDKYQKVSETLDQFIEGLCFRNWTDEMQHLDQQAIENRLEKDYILTWSQDSHNELPAAVSHPLFTKSKKSGLLESGFDAELHKVIVEGTYWHKIFLIGMVSLPNNVNKLLQRKETLRVLRENVMLIVRDYNNIKHTISDSETALFAEHLGALEMQISPGIRKFNWTSTADFFVNSVRKDCKMVYEQVKKFQNNVQKIQSEFDKIGRTTLANVEKNLYNLPDFVTQQENALKQKEGEFTAAFNRVSREVMDTYELFIRKRPNIQEEWLKFMTDLDSRLALALKQSVKTTLLYFGKHIMGDKGSESDLVAIFNVYTILEVSPRDDKWNIIHEPTHDILKVELEAFMRKIIKVTRVVPRIERVFRENREACIQEIKKIVDDAERASGNTTKAFENAGIKGDNNYPNMTEEEKDQWWKDRFELPHPMPKKHEYEERITRNEKIQAKVNEILKGIDNVSTAIEEDKRHWNASEERRQLSSMSKDKWLRRMLQGQNNLAEADPVAQYRDILDNLACVVTDIQNRPAVKPEKFINLDCGRLKASLLEHVKDIEQTIYSHLINEAKRDLTELLDEWQTIITTLKQPATHLELLKTNKALHEQVTEKLPIYDGQREPIRLKFNFIKTNEDAITNNDLTEEDKLKLEGLDDAFQRFKDGLEDAASSIRRHNQQLKTEVDNQIEDFKKECQEMRADFKKNAPYAVDKDGRSDYTAENNRAFEKLAQYRTQTVELRSNEEALKLGLDIFEMEAVPYPEVTIVEKEIEELSNIWTIKKEWDAKWDRLKDVQFRELDPQEMEEDSYEFKARLKDLNKEVKEWKVYEFMLGELTKFADTMPLIASLQHVSMRARHWKDIRMEVKDDFEEDGEDFNLKKIFGLNLLQYQDKINDTCDNARKQLTIEQGLQGIERAWTVGEQSDLVVAKEKSRADNTEYYYIKDTAEIMQLIEDHGGHLGTYKSSPYYKEFQEDIDNWEQRIASVTETLETLMTVQKLWQYLEQIFKGQQDIQKQLPNDDAIFKKYDAIFKDEMLRINGDKNALNALLVPGFLSLLNKLQYSFEGIQKSLNSFLEQKRGQFPRFYFLSNKDLLEMIGQSKEPLKIISHIRKIFEGIYNLGVPNETKGSRKNVDVDEIQSAEGEAIGFNKPIEVDAKVEIWMQKLEEEMKKAIRQQFYRYISDNSTGQRKQHDRERMLRQVKEVPGQILIGLSQMSWTSELDISLRAIQQDGNKTHMKQTKKNFKKKIETYVDIVDKQQLDKKERLRLVALIIIDVHHYEIINMLIDKGVSNVNAFEWQQQLRFKKKHDDVDQAYIQVMQTKTSFDYGCEYQGNNGRLVVTALTDRCYMTLTSALNMHRGGAPQGPAGTGKTETVKDLGKNLAFYVVIQNCSDRDDIFSLGRLFAGLALSGSWGCFDEFNRISVEVLSVVAFQVQTILDALRKGEQSTHFGELTIHVKVGTGLFITMNPGYAGRSELPDNLASLFRPVAMMKPDFQGIIKIQLMSEGFRESDELSKKIAVIYDLMLKQLSKSDHYDFGMRAIKSVLNATGRIKRDNRDMKEVTVAIKAIRDMNLPKFIAEDVVLFDNLFMDLFPDCDEPENDNDELQIAIEECLQAKNLMLNENLIVKIMQLYESKVTRHSNMLVGKSMAGKSRCWQILQDACNQLQEQEVGKNIPEDKKRLQVRTDVINPKAIDNDELFGYYDDQTPPQWMDGILSAILKRICEEKTYQQWMVLDGPVDTLWIESLNSVMDDSKLLTLTNGERIFLTPNVKLLFEVENLAVASPATVSRAGMIYMDIDELGWEPYMTMWIAGKASQGEDYQALLKSLVDKYLYKVLKHKSTVCTELVKTSESACIINMCNLYDALSSKITKGEEESTDDYNLYIEKWFIFSLFWSIGAAVDENSRREIDNILRDIDSLYPAQATCFEYFIKLEKRDFVNWEDELKSSMKIQETEFHKITVPTVDTVRNRYIVQALLEHGSQVLLIGHAGVGKTVLMNGILAGLDHTTSNFTINFSAGTTSNSTQDIIEGNFERRAKNKYKPKNAKAKVVCYIDDLNMPRRDEFGSQPPLELIRQWIDYECWYDRAKIVLNHIQNLQVLAAMGPPGGGRQPISNRLLSCFHTITYTIPSEGNMNRIYKTIAEIKFAGFNEDIKQQCERMAMATINIFNIIQQRFLPTPSKSHYVFNMRDVSKVFQGLFMANKNYYESKEQVGKLWAHEVLRVFNDRLNTVEDQVQFKTILDEQLNNVLDLNYEEHCTTEGQDAIFVDFLNDLGEQIYQEVTDFDKLRAHMNEVLSRYNSQPKLVKMDLVLFKDALIHVSKIYRILNLKRGHGLLIGVGGSGRHSLTRLASFLQKMNVFQLEVTRGFKLKNFREFLKTVFEMAGFRGRENLKTTFIFSDNDVVQESFLEDIQNLLNSGVVPNLFANDEMAKLRDDFRRTYKREAKGQPETPEAMDGWFLNNVKDNLHLSITFSPLSKSFKDYCRNYPALINNTTIDWFMPWPVDALNEVAVKYVGALDVEEEMVQPIAAVCAYAHATTGDAAQKMVLQLKRVFYVTPTNYIELLKGYGKILEEKRKIVTDQAKKLRDGLSKLEGARQQVEKMQAASDIKRQEVQRNTREVDELLVKISAERKVADEKQVFITAERAKIEKEAEEAEALAAEAEADLAVYEPELKAAEAAIAQLDSKSISEVKSYTTPPEQVMTVMSAVMIVLGKEPTWPTAKKMMTDSGFINTIKDYDKESTSQNTVRRIERYTREEKFRPEYVSGVSKAAGILCMWVKAVEGYAKALKTVAPKRARMQFAKDQVAKKMATLKELEEEYEALARRLAELQEIYDTKNGELAEFQRVLEDLQTKIDRGDRLIQGLAGEKLRWEATIDELDIKYENLIGDCLLSAAFMSYCGPFPSDYRLDLVQNWVNMVQMEKIKTSPGYDFATFMASEAQARAWQLNGLPTDAFSTENGCFVSKGLRWALNIDPQTQAMNWIKKMEGDNLEIADFKDPNHIKRIEMGITYGKKVLFLDVGEELDPVLDNVLNKSLVSAGGRLMAVKIGDKEIEYNPNFKLYITTRMSNPHYTPEVSTKVTVVNFQVKEDGLEEQCLGIVVLAEQPAVETNRGEQIMKIEQNNAKALELEDTILQMLQDANPELILEDVALIDTLSQSKETQIIVKESLMQAKLAMRKINDMREQYRRCGRQAAILFFVLNDLNKINTMYQFSLDWYKNLFRRSITESGGEFGGAGASGSKERSDEIIKKHMQNVYDMVCRSLFERHKVLLSMQMCIKRQMISENPPDMNEWNFFLKGGEVLDRTTQLPKPPFEWITQQAWDNLTELDKLSDGFKTIATAVSLSPKDWQRWYEYPDPENKPLPGEWQTKCEDPLKAMVVLRCLRPDRVTNAIKNYVEKYMGSYFTISNPTILKDVFADSASHEPIIFVLSPGVDPTDALKKLAAEQQIEFETNSMGKGQADKARKIVDEGAQKGKWIFLANCHLSISLLPELESIMDNLFKGQDDPKKSQDQKVNDNFRLILSAAPHPDFSISLLQRSLKITQEPPKGIKANMLRLYGAHSEFHTCERHREFRKAVFGLSWFHTILIERKKFKSLGWNVLYSFNDSDFQVCEDLLAVYMGKMADGKPVDENYQPKAPVPWPAIITLIAQCNYGGRVTDDHDRRLMGVYAKEIFNDNLIGIDQWKPPGTEEENYGYPADEANFNKGGADPTLHFTPQFFYDAIKSGMEQHDQPRAYGQHVNAEINSQILDTNELLQSILTLTPQEVSAGGGGDDGTLKKINDLAAKVPELIDKIALKMKLKADSGNPMNVVLQQEVERYEILLVRLKIDLEALDQGLKGLIVITPELEKIVTALQQNVVPTAWSFAYFSMKPLSNWFEDLRNRYEFFDTWAQKSAPYTFWLGAFTYPTGFTTSLLQRFSRKSSGAPIDQLQFEFVPIPRPPAEIIEHPKDGAFIRELHLEGAKWDYDTSALAEAKPMELTCPMPVLHFKPVTKQRKAPANMYSCPCYYYPQRKGTVTKDSYQLNVELKSGEFSTDFWVKRGTAILLSLPN